MADRSVDKISEDLAKDYVSFKLGKTHEAPKSSAAKELRRLATDLEKEHGELFDNMLKSLNGPQQDNDSMFLNIASEMFADHIINWGRIAVLYTFAGQMAVYCEKNNMKAESARVPLLVGKFVKQNLSSWIEKSGGWDAFSEYFKEKKDGNDMWWGNVLCTFGLVAGAALVFAR